MRTNTSRASLGSSSFASLETEPASVDDAETWVSGELVSSLMRASRGGYVYAMVAIPAVAALCWGYVPLWQLLSWLAFGVGITLCCTWMERVYFRRYASRSAREQAYFIHRHRFLWNARALTFGLSVALFFERTPQSHQFLCWLIVAGAGAFPLNSLALHLPLLRRFENTLFTTVLVIVAARLAQGGLLPLNFNHSFLLLPAFYWWMLLRAGRRIHETARNSFELLFHNRILINSLTQQRQAAVAAVAMKDRFLVSAAHDMRQPVLALSLYADWLSNEPELVDEIAPKIVRATHAVNALFDSLFDLARIDSGQVRLHIERVDVAQLLHDLELQYRPLAEAKGLRFKLRVQQGTVRTDPVRVRRMIGNLLSNAIKYTHEGGVLLAARRGREGLRVEVWDTGIGIPNGSLRDVFLEFYKVADDHAGTSDGFGLGLAIVSRLSHALGHPVSVRSQLGRGSMFSVVLRDAVEGPPRASGGLG